MMSLLSYFKSALEICFLSTFFGTGAWNNFGSVGENKLGAVLDCGRGDKGVWLFLLLLLLLLLFDVLSLLTDENDEA